MEYMFFFSVLLMFMFGLVGFCSVLKPLLLTLLSLEFIVLSLFLMFFYFLSIFGYEYYFSLIFFTFSVCEGALGLSILVSLICSHGNDYVFSLSVLLW
uniref:NADH-ubiquinone oxidoreductase chain 4L n=1 Tax=Ochterus marginatus TaxID=280162 RepID=C5HIW1_9HEMI|nr:NADH dehydrogenase subunit 4L [Ochterus marginatus]